MATKNQYRVVGNDGRGYCPTLYVGGDYGEALAVFRHNQALHVWAEIDLRDTDNTAHLIHREVI